ncbi:Uncharacterised protein [Afipia felis]|uniref:Uncharacterized protein n=1 Tax=Afipia felis TaxID=1035 RepID=A0A380W3D9_AFIFE|nr:Uncharacterised protein [Afipia felis]
MYCSESTRCLGDGTPQSGIGHRGDFPTGAERKSCGNASKASSTSIRSQTVSVLITRGEGIRPSLTISSKREGDTQNNEEVFFVEQVHMIDRQG